MASNKKTKDKKVSLNKVGGLFKKAASVAASAAAGFGVGRTISGGSKTSNPNANRDVSGNSTRISVSPKQTPKQEKKRKVDTTKAVFPKKESSTRSAFNKAFASARKAGKKEFSFRGKRFNTKLKGE